MNGSNSGTLSNTPASGCVTCRVSPVATVWTKIAACLRPTKSPPSSTSFANANFDPSGAHDGVDGRSPDPIVTLAPWTSVPTPRLSPSQVVGSTVVDASPTGSHSRSGQLSSSPMRYATLPGVPL